MNQNQSQTPLLIIIAGSKADEKHYQAIVAAAKEFSLETIVRIGSAHKTAGHVSAMLEQYEADSRPKIYITIAGRSNALSGFIDGAVTAPVIACPPPSESFAGADIFSSLRMPSGIAATVVLEPKNVVLLAAKIFALHNPALLTKVKQFQQQQRQRILDDDASLRT